jgi:hypothetical protein
MSRPHHNLDAWKESMRLVRTVYQLSQAYSRNWSALRSCWEDSTGKWQGSNVHAGSIPDSRFPIPGPRIVYPHSPFPISHFPWQ